MRNLTIVLMLGLTVLASRTAAEEPSCSACGCRCGLKPVCRLVCETKDVKEVVYDCECEDFCLPGPSKHCGHRYECDCDAHGKSRHIIWKPSCGKVHTRHVLIKREVTKQVPTYRCEVVYVCDNCCGQGGCAAGNGSPMLPPDASLETPVPPTAKTATGKKSLFLTSLFGK